MALVNTGYGGKFIIASSLHYLSKDGIQLAYVQPTIFRREKPYMITYWRWN
jgi:hypothetical protein